MTHLHADLIVALQSYGQADEDGVMCNVSRQAVEEAIAILSAPVTLAQAMQCPEVQAMVEALQHARTVLIVTSVTATTGGGIYPAYLDEQADNLQAVLATILALSANNERTTDAN